MVYKKVEELARSILEFYKERDKLKVHCKNFDINSYYLKGNLNSVNVENTVKDFLGDFLNNEKNKVKIVPLISPIPNMYLLCVLTALSKLLSIFIDMSKDAGLDVFEQLEIEMLMMQVVRGKTEIKYLTEPLKEHNRQIIDFGDKLEVGINVCIPFVESLTNIIIKKLEMLNSKTVNKILRSINYRRIEDYVRELPGLRDEWKEKLRDIENKEGYRLSDQYILHMRARNVLFKTELIYDILRIVGNYLESDGGNVKYILIFAEPVKKIIEDFRFRNLIGDNTNIMIMYYSDPVHPEDTQKIMENIPSYITFLSFYHNKNILPYGLDEYYHVAMLKIFKNGLFDLLPALVEEICNKDVVKYAKEKAEELDTLNYHLSQNHKATLIQAVETIKQKYIEKGEEILKIENEGFLYVQDTTLEHLRFLL